ncbi:MAG: porin family protein [Bacteroidia bacterium]
MKYFIHTLALFLIVSVPAFSQVNLGAKGGLNLSNLSLNDFSQNMRPGFHAGLYFNIPVYGSGSIQPEVMYSMKGARFTSEGKNINARLDYLDIPLLVIFDVSPRLDFHFGPQFSYLAHVNYRCEDRETSETWELNDQSNFSSVDIGLALGFEYNFNTFNLGLRYSSGFNSIENDDMAVINGNEMIRTGANNSVLQLYLAVPINE